MILQQCVVSSASISSLGRWTNQGPPPLQRATPEPSHVLTSFSFFFLQSHPLWCVWGADCLKSDRSRGRASSSVIRVTQQPLQVLSCISFPIGPLSCAPQPKLYCQYPAMHYGIFPLSTFWRAAKLSQWAGRVQRVKAGGALTSTFSTCSPNVLTSAEERDTSDFETWQQKKKYDVT